MTRPTLSRRMILRGAGVTLGLPLLDAMTPPARAAKPPAGKQRMVTLCNYLGLHGPLLFPEKSGRSYESTPYLDVIKDYRDDFTVFSGVSHPDVDGGHSSESSYLTAAPHPGSSSFKNSISIDQYAAERIGSETRFGYLALTSGGSNGLSWSRSGVRIPADDRPSRVFGKLFLQGEPDEVKRQVNRLRDGQSIMDTVLGQAKSMQRDLGARDKVKLDEYFSSVRELEQRLVKGEQWATKPKPKVDVQPPKDVTDRTDIIARQKLMYDLVHLAIQTDSTRLITFALSATNSVPPIDGVTVDWHNLSHHGKDPEKIKQLRIIETQELQLFAELLAKLKSTKEEGETLLDRTMVMMGSNLGNASSHNTRNMPVILAGGGFKHGQHLAFDQSNNYPLCNLYVSMLQRLGLEVDRFASSTGTMTGLDMKA